MGSLNLTLYVDINPCLNTLTVPPMSATNQLTMFGIPEDILNGIHPENPKDADCKWSKDVSNHITIAADILDGIHPKIEMIMNKPVNFNNFQESAINTENKCSTCQPADKQRKK